MNNEGVPESQHPENAKSSFQAAVENQLNEAPNQFEGVRKPDQCNGGEPDNVSSGPDLARCDDRGLQAHLRCLSGEEPLVQVRSTANHDQQVSDSLVNTVQQHFRPVSDLADTEGAPMDIDQQEIDAECFLCHKNGSIGPVVSIKTYANMSEVHVDDAACFKAYNLDHAHARSQKTKFTELLRLALSSSAESDGCLLDGLRVHPQCLNLGISLILSQQDNWSLQIFNADEPEQLLRTENTFWQKLADQFPLEKNTSNSDEIILDSEMEGPAENEYAESDTKVEDKGKETNMTKKGENEKKQGGGAQQQQTTLTGLLKIRRTSSNNESEQQHQSDSQQRIVHKINTTVNQVNRRSSSLSQGQQNQSNNTQQLAQTTLFASAAGTKRNRRPPVKGYEQFLDPTEESKAPQKSNNQSNHATSKRPRTERTSGIDQEMQPSLNHFIEHQSTLGVGEGKQIKLNLTKPEEAGGTNAEKKLLAQDPFNNPFINDIFKPIMAADKLQVLRKDKEKFDVFIMAKDLKVFSKDKRDALLLDYDEEKDKAILAKDAEQDEEFSEEKANSLTQEIAMKEGAGDANPTPQVQINPSLTEPRAITQQSSCDTNQDGQSKSNKPKRRKKASNLSRQANRRTTPGAELSWIGNLAFNRKIFDRVQQEIREEKQKQNEAIQKQRQITLQRNKQLRIEQVQRQFAERQLQDKQESMDGAKDNQDVEEVKNNSDSAINGNHIINNTVDQSKENGNSDNNQQEKVDEEMKDEEGKSTGDKDEPFKFKDRSQVKTIDHLYALYNLGYYHKLETLQDDVRFLVEKVIRTRCKNELAKSYLDKVLQSSLQHLDRKKNDFNVKWRSFFENKFRDNALNPKVEYEWQKYAGAKRQYFTIDDYKVITCADMGKLPDTLTVTPASCESEEYQKVIKKMQTKKKSSCGAECPCQDHSVEMRHKLSQTELLAQASLTEDKYTQKSDFIQNDFQCCFHRKVECGKDCGCDPETCRNRQMTMKQQLVLGRDVEERTAWGMDSYTAFNLCALRPRDFPPNLYSGFLEYRMMFAVQQQGSEGYDLRNALQFILDSEPRYPETGHEVDQPLTDDDLSLWTEKSDPCIFSYMEKQLARMILEAIKNLKGENDPHFRIHSKGLGIFCNRREGIKKNSLLVEYFGEIYQQWLWYEKQDILKQGQQKQVLSKDLPDFYNITYERHYDDPDGYDVLTVDPILFGNFASRLSHSCNPNCETITKIKQDEGMYSIGMFSQKDIRFGQELCFNYCSFTESEEEHRNAACLCGSMICQGRFLNLAIAQKNQGLQKEYHTFIDRNLILYSAIVACYPDGEGITAEDQERLDKFGIKGSVLDDIPRWLKKWAALICEFVQFEQENYPDTMRGKDSEINIQIELKNLKDSKLSNIAITINKVVRILKLLDTEEPPIRKMKHQEIYHALWGSPDSVKHQMVETLSQIDECDEVTQCFEFIKSVDEDGSPKSAANKEGFFEQKEETDKNESKYAQKVQQIRCVLLYISQELRGIKSKKVAIPALCDNLVLYAKTETYFTPNDYTKTQGQQVHIRKCDVAGQASDTKELELAVRDQGKTVYKGQKEYQAHHIWGQLIGWYKQTVDKPNSSLSADRRGSLSMPDITSFIVSYKNQSENIVNSGRQTAKKKRGRKSSSDFAEEVMPTMGSSTRRRPLQGSTTGNSSAKPSTVRPAHDANGVYVVPEDKELKITYPHKKYQTREQFLQHWEEFFSKHWDTCCHWSFKNKHKLYGSIGFESVLKAGKDRKNRLQYFTEVVDELRGYQE